jgi:putative addiction module component (TIGR02574 family)
MKRKPIMEDLAAADRSRLVESLPSSLSDAPAEDIEAAWDVEIEQRVAAHGRGEVVTFSAEEVFAEARRIAPNQGNS